MLAFDCLHDLDYHTGKPYGLTAYHKKLVKTNENKSIQEFKLIFCEKKSPRIVVILMRPTLADTTD